MVYDSSGYEAYLRKYHIVVDLEWDLKMVWNKASDIVASRSIIEEKSSNESGDE
jgi:hypothetical protein